MQTFDQSLFELFQKDLISFEEALRQATNPDDFKLKVDGIHSTAEMAQDEMAAAADPHDPSSPFEFS
jgi:twitching motility protein PilT